jgi:hypothetical protein
MQDVADQEARDLVDALKAIGLEGVTVRARVFPPQQFEPMTSASTGNMWGKCWLITLRVAWRGREVSVERPEYVAAYTAITARTIKRILLGAYDSEYYRSDKQRERTAPPLQDDREYVRNHATLRHYLQPNGVEALLDLDAALKP